jgi:AcrR family transcriptional regulator
MPRKPSTEKARPRGAGQAPDRRVRRTKKQLREALVNLILERGWDAVSVIDVCARADVGRSTFYTHFVDKEDLLLSGFDDLHVALGEKRLEVVGTFGFVEMLVDHAREHVKLFRALVGKKSGQSVQRRFRDVVTRLCEAELQALGVEDHAVVARYVSGGFVEMLVAWLDRPARMDGRALTAMFRELTLGAVAGIGTRGRRCPDLAGGGGIVG